jgi:thymidylate synthase (FAD)
MIEFIKDKMDKGHESPLEHCNFTFTIEGVSRALSHQLVRHRIASYSQQSQRYCRLGQFEYVIPPEIEKDFVLKSIFIHQMESSQLAYNRLVKGLIINDRTEKQAIEDARYVFPNACCTNLIMTMNLRTFRHFFSERTCKHAQWEISYLAYEAMNEVKRYIPFADYKAKKCGISCFECKEEK